MTEAPKVAVAPAPEAANDDGDGEGLWESLDVEGKVRKHPYAAVATALGVGYVLGGGLFTSTTRRLIGLGIRLAAVPPVRDALLDVAESAVDALLVATAKPKSE